MDNWLFVRESDNRSPEEGYQKIVVAEGFFDKVKKWVKEKWTGTKELEVDKKSEAIDEIKYNKRKKLLEIKFQKRGTYQYVPVPQNVVEKFVQANSLGKFFNRYIRDRYRYKKVATSLYKIQKISSILLYEYEHE